MDSTELGYRPMASFYGDGNKSYRFVKKADKFFNRLSEIHDMKYDSTTQTSDEDVILPNSHTKFPKLKR